MIALSVEAGPVHVLSMGTTIDNSDADRYLAALDDAVDRGLAFGVVLQYGDRKPKHVAGVRDREVRWVKERRAAFSATCVGIAFVHPAGPIERGLERLVLTGVAPRFFGVPCRRYDSVDGAGVWLRSLLR